MCCDYPHLADTRDPYGGRALLPGEEGGAGGRTPARAALGGVPARLLTSHGRGPVWASGKGLPGLGMCEELQSVG